MYGALRASLRPLLCPSSCRKLSQPASPIPLFAAQWATAVKKFGDKNLLTFDDLAGVEEQISYRDMDARSNQLARYLQTECGLSRGERLVTVAENRPEMIEVLLACHKIGAILVPLATDLMPDHLHYLVDVYELPDAYESGEK